ncbi:MAG: hypothetical protein TU35_003400 [Thermoproteus sp. AZ2]|uniref:Uncharacterized protein n=1 Tax=Thermoproteus sp. AZ2 TaxID=1609232 RepID=A0ACC6V036_9CREN|nr:MAG: hypothetical protein TU35_06525 [Thermoproteus sp. AZ2]
MGGRRRRRKIIQRPRRTIPKIFVCPNCGAQSVNVKKMGDKYVVICGSCGLREEFEERPRWAPVDYYNAFVDHFLEGKITPPAAPQPSNEEGAEGEGAEEGGEGEEGEEGGDEGS